MDYLRFINANRPLDNEPGSAPAILLDLYDQVTTFGDTVKSRTGKVKELMGVRFTLWPEDIKHLESYYNDRPSFPFKRADVDAFCSAMLAGEAIPAFEAPGSLAYAKAIEKLETLITLLQADNLTRRAILSIGADTCYSSLQVLIRGGQIHLFLNARSVNLTAGAPLDALFWSRMVMKPLAEALHLSPGGMHFSVASLHLNV